MKKQSRGLTLIELIVVVAILAVLAMIVLPKLDGVQSNANHAVGANSAADTARYIQTYRTMKQRFPDGWDSLMSSTNPASFYAKSNPGNTTSGGTPPYGKGLHLQLEGNKLTTYQLVATDVESLNLAGIYTLYHAVTPTSSSIRPSDMFTSEDSISSGDTVAIVNASTAAGRKIIDSIYRENRKVGGVSGTLPAGKQLVVFGFGPLNKLVGSMMQEAPYYPNVDTSLVYGRNLVVFEVGTSGSSAARAIFRTVMGSDGDLQDDLTTYINRDVQ
jgi:general secretion pathway protein G